MAPETAPHHAYIGIGSNQADPVRQVREAFDALARLPSTTLKACSPLYRTAPVGKLDQPDFINAVARLETALAPDALLQALLAIELRHGRVRGERNAPRTLDLDLLLYDALELDSPGLTLPHPRLHMRAFVLRPLAEVSPALVVPGRGPVRTLLEQVSGQRVEPLN